MIARQLAAQTYPLSDVSLERFAAILVRRELKKGALWLNQGEICHELGYVHQGMVRQFYYKNNKEMTEHFSCEGSVFICIESFLRQQPSSLLVEALEPTRFPDETNEELPEEPISEEESTEEPPQSQTDILDEITGQMKLFDD